MITSLSTRLLAVAIAILCVANSANAQRVIRLSEQGTLQERFENAARSAEATDAWIGYSITRRMGSHSYIGSYGSGNWGGRPVLGDWIEGRVSDNQSESVADAVRRELNAASDDNDDRSVDEMVEKELAILVRTGGRSAEPAAIKSMNLSSRFDSDGLNLYWVGAASDEQSFTLLKGFLSKASDSDVRKSLVYSIGFHDDAAGVVPLLKQIASGDGESKVRKAAVYSIGSQRDPSVPGFLTQIARSEGPTEVRKSAVYSLSNVDESESFAALDKILGDASVPVEVRKAALYSMGNTSSDKVRKRLLDVAMNDADESLSKAAVYALAKAAEDDSSVLLSILDKSAHQSVRKAAVYAIGNQESVTAVAALKRITGGSYDTEIRKAAVYALGNIGTPEAREAILSVLND